MKWLDSGLPALVAIVFAVGFVGVAVEEGSIAAAWMQAGRALIGMAAIATAIVAGRMIYLWAQKPGRGP